MTTELNKDIYKLDPSKWAIPKKEEVNKAIYRLDPSRWVISKNNVNRNSRKYSG